jgi:hypothetical protein
MVIKHLLLSDHTFVTFEGNGSKTITNCTSITKLSTIFKVSAQYKLVNIIKYNKNNSIY